MLYHLLIVSRAKSSVAQESKTWQTLATEIEIDWMACELIEQVPGKVSGRPIIRGTRIMPNAIAGAYELGETLEEIQEGFPSLSTFQIKRLIEFAQAQRKKSSR